MHQFSVQTNIPLAQWKVLPCPFSIIPVELQGMKMSVEVVMR